MRKLVIALLVLIIVVAALLGWALYNIDSVVASYKDRIIAAVERHSGRKVAFERISVKLRGGVGVRILEFSMAEDPDFGAGHFLQAADVRVDLKIRPLQRQISVTRVVLRRPVIQVIRDARGVYNFSGLGPHGTAARQSPWPPGFGAVAAAFAAAEPRGGRAGADARRVRRNEGGSGGRPRGGLGGTWTIGTTSNTIA